MPRPQFAPEQEIRFAVVMYGGVSLAIYINGVVQELLRMVRATAPEFELPDKPHEQDVYFPTESLSGTELVYREVGQSLPEAATGPADESDDLARTRREARGTASQSAPASSSTSCRAARPAGSTRSSWPRRSPTSRGSTPCANCGCRKATSACCSTIAAPYKQLTGVKHQKPPKSLLNSARLHLRAWEALKAMAKTEERREDKYSPAYVEELDLFVTTTDLQGLRLPIQLSDRAVYELRHKNVLRFGYAGPRATGDQRNEFTDENDDVLAFAARCTSAFPFAFEPAQIGERPGAQGDEPPAHWGHFFPDYVARDALFAEYAFADGGYLDNKPFTYATDALRRRRADVPVQRKLLYVEPDPTGEPLPPDTPPLNAEDPKPPPDALGNVATSMLLPRVENIREDIQAVVERNRAVRRIGHLTRGLVEGLFDGDDPLSPLRDVPRDASDQIVEDEAEVPAAHVPPLRAAARRDHP